MSVEATSGKNPINHVGKIYNLLSFEITNDVVQNVEGVKQINLMIFSQIGKPINQPKAALAGLILEDGYEMDKVSPQVNKIIDNWLENISDITEKVVQGKARTF